MTRVGLSTTVDEQLRADARRLRDGTPDSMVIDDAVAALLARHRSAQVDAAYPPMTSTRGPNQTSGAIWPPPVRLRGRRELHGGQG